MAINPNLYRFVDFIGGNILDAANVITEENQSLLRDKQGIGSVYEDGTLLNASFVITGSTITLHCANNSFPVLIFIRGTFETLVSAGGSFVLPANTFLASNTYPLYFNWSLNIKTSADDSTFTDGSTGEPTIEMGELAGTSSGSDTTITSGISWTDTSGVVLNPAIQFEKNTSPIVLADFITDVSDNITVTYINGVFPYALANTRQAGLVNLTDDSGLAPGNTDARLSNTRTPSNQSIIDPMVKDLVVTNSSTVPPQYDPAAGGQGGIFTGHIIYTTLKQKLTDFLDSVNAAINNAIAELAAHIGQPLGSPATHPFPTAAQVGAAPASHVGQVLGLATSHPAQVNSDTGGFVVDELTTSVSGDAYGLYSSSSVRKAAIKHNGDIFSLLANSHTASAVLGNGSSADPNNGPLGLMSTIAAILSDHVNLHTHGDNNPHNLSALDIGAASTAYVDAGDANTLAAAQTYTDNATGVTVRYSFVPGGSYGAEDTPGGLASYLTTQSYMNYTIIRIGQNASYFELAIGTGAVHALETIPLPDGGAGWSTSQFTAEVGLKKLYNLFDNQGIGQGFSAQYNPSSRQAAVYAYSEGSHNYRFANYLDWVHVTAVAWRHV